MFIQILSTNLNLISVLYNNNNNNPFPINTVTMSLNDKCS